MKKLSLLAIFAIAAFSYNANAQTTANASNDAYATIIAPITITAAIPLEFGNIIAGVGTVTVSTNTGGVSVFSNSAMNPGVNQDGTPTTATFNVTGQKDYTYSIAFANATETLTLSAGNTMSVGAFKANSATVGGVDGLAGKFNASNADVISVGATLTVTNGAAQVAGLYAGTFNVTVAYN